MRKLFTIFALISLSACSSVHRGEANIAFKSPAVIASPMEVDIVPGEKISATEECNSYFFGLFGSLPNERMYGPELMENAGNFAPNVCTKGALYKAVRKSGADVVLMPRYSTKGTRFLCFPFTDLCLIKKQAVTVNGIAGKYAAIKKMSPETSEQIKVKLATLTNEKSEKEDKSFFRYIPFFGRMTY